MIAVAQYRPGANWKLMPERQARTKRSQGEKVESPPGLRRLGSKDWPRSIRRTKPILQNARIVLSHSGNDRYRNIRSPGSTHWGCRSTTPAVRLAPGRRSNGLSKQSRCALFASASPFQPGSKPHHSIARSHLRLTSIGYPPSWRLVDWRCK